MDLVGWLDPSLLRPLGMVKSLSCSSPRGSRSLWVASAPGVIKYLSCLSPQGSLSLWVDWALKSHQVFKSLSCYESESLVPHKVKSRIFFIPAPDVSAGKSGSWKSNRYGLQVEDKSSSSTEVTLILWMVRSKRLQKNFEVWFVPPPPKM